MSQTAPEAPDAPQGARPPRGGRAQQLLSWGIAAACFAYLYYRISAAAGDQGVVAYLLGALAQVRWGAWLALMMPYSAFYFAIDSLVVWRVINWFNTRVRYRDILPIRGSSYILSIVNEQVGKGAMGVYLNRRDGIPGWEVASSMFFIMFCEFYYLLGWALLGYALAAEELPGEFGLIPYLAVPAALFFLGFWLFMSGRILPGATLRERPFLRAFRLAAPWQYLALIALRSPAMLGAVYVYSLAAGLFGVSVSPVQMLGYLPVIFFGAATPGPMRSVAITLWVVLFPGYEAQMATFGLVQHNFFIFFNAVIGLLFLRRANRELFGTAPATAP